MRSIWPVRVVDLKLRPKELPQMVLEGRVPEKRIAEIANERTRFWNSRAKRRPSGQTMIRVDRDLHANRRLNVEVTPALAEGQRRLRNQDIVRDTGSVTAWNGHLEEARHDVVSALLRGGNEPVLHKKGRPASRGSLGAPRHWRGSQNYFCI